MGRRRIVLGSLVVALAAAGAVVAVFVLGSGGSPRPAAAATGAARVDALLDGIPQRGEALGSPSAPVTLVEFADLQCPYCGIWARDALPTIVDRYVRPGKVRLVFRGLSFLGPDSLTALRTALAAAEQNRLWNVLELLFDNQGAENAGWVTEPLLRDIGDAVPGLDGGRMLDERGSPAVDRAIAEANAAAREAGVRSTPSFAVGPTGGTLRLVRLSSLAPSALGSVLDAALSR